MERSIRNGGQVQALRRTGLGLALAALVAVPAFADDDVRADEAIRLIEAGTIQSLEALNQAAIARHAGAQIEESDLEKVYGRYVYKIELRDADGVQWDVDLDASTGEVLEDRRDD